MTLIYIHSLTVQMGLLQVIFFVFSRVVFLSQKKRKKSFVLTITNNGTLDIFFIHAMLCNTCCHIWVLQKNRVSSVQYQQEGMYSLLHKRSYGFVTQSFLPHESLLQPVATSVRLCSRQSISLHLLSHH